MEVHARRQEGLGRWIFAAFLVLSLGLPAFAQRDAGGGIAVVPPRADPAVTSLASGVAFWIHDRLAAAEMDVLPLEETDAALTRPPGGYWDGTELEEIASRASASYVLLTDFRYERGEVRVHLRLYDATQGELLSAGYATGPLARVGKLLKHACGPLLRGVGFSATPVEKSLPLPATLAAYPRALAALREGHLPRAWKELAGRPGPTAKGLRDAIVAASRKAPVGTRVRLKALSGIFDHDWIRLRVELRDSEEAEVLLARGDGALARHGLDQALVQYDAVHESEPQNVAAILGQARVHALARRFSKARTAYRKAVELEPEDPAPVAALAALPGSAAGERAELLLEAGDLHALRWNRVKARQSYKAAARADASTATAAWGRIGALDERMGRHGSALLAYERAVELGANEFEIWLCLGRVRRFMKDPEGAEQALQKALALVPDHPEARLELAAALREAGRHSEALPILERLVAERPRVPASRRALASVLDDLDDAEGAVLVLMAERGPGEPGSEELRDAAQILLASGAFAAADEALSRALALEPDDPRLHRIRARVKEAAGQAEAARASYERGAALSGASRADSAAGADPYFGDIAFERLVEKLPNFNRETGEPIRRVIFLGLRQGDDFGGLLSWLSPLRPDIEGLERQLRQALAQRFALAELPDLRKIGDAVDDLRAFQDAPSLVPLVNTWLGSDGTIAAQLVKRGSEGALSIDLRLYAGKTAPKVVIHRAVESLPPASAGLTRWSPLALMAYSVIFGLAGFAAVLLFRSARDRRAVGQSQSTASLYEGLELELPTTTTTGDATEEQEVPEQEVPEEEASEQDEVPEQEAPEQEVPEEEEVPEQEASEEQEVPEQEASEEQEAPEDEAPDKEAPEDEASEQEVPEDPGVGEAAEIHEISFDSERSIEDYRKDGSLPELLDLLEKTGRYTEAAEVALECEEPERVIRNLESVDFENADNGPRLLDRLTEAIALADDDTLPRELLERFGQLLESAGRGGEALSVYWRIREREASPDQADGGGADASERYEVLEELGRGSVGIVYKARDTRLGRVVALKRLPNQLDGHALPGELILLEARAAASLDHPNIVALYDADRDAEGYFVAMEFLEGDPLHAVLQRQGRLAPREVVRLGIQITAGLHYAHEQRVIHRDMRTSNLFVTEENVVKIMDFGLAKVVEELRSYTALAGPPYYLSPEQTLGNDVDLRSDLYSLGVTLFELSTGTLPFQEGNVPYHHVHTAPPDPREKAPDLPDDLTDLILALLAKNADDRPANARVVRQALRKINRSFARS